MAVSATGGRTGAGGVPGVGGASASPDAGARPDLTGKKALFIVSSPSGPDDGEVMIQELLEVRGMIVTLGDDATPPAMASGYDVVVLSSNATNAAAPFKSVAVPVVVFGNTSIYQPMGFVANSSSRGSTSGAPQAAIMDTSTALSSDLQPGSTIDVFNQALGNGSYTWGTPGGSPIKVATIAGTPAEVVVFGYETGAAMASGTAAARRVSLGWKSSGVKLLTLPSFKLQDGEFSWAVGGVP